MMTRDEIKRQFGALVRGDESSGFEVDALVDAIIDAAAEEALDRIASRDFERRSTERRVGFERKGR